jgi:hypothetical protein
MSAKTLIILFFLVCNGFSRTIATIHLDSLFYQSDFVGVVTIKSGELQALKGAFYVGKIVEIIKGNSTLKEVKFGEYSGLSIGVNYLIFLRKASNDSFYFTQSLKLETTHLIQDKQYILKHFKPDEVIKVPTNSIILPKKMKSFIVDKSNLVWSKDKILQTKWVKTEDLLIYLRKLKRAT